MCFRNFKVIIISLLISGLDMSFDFFILKFLSFFSCNNNCTLKREFDLMIKSNSTAKSGLVYYMYICYIISFIDTLFLYCYMIYISKYKRINTNYLKSFYNKKMETVNTVTYLTSHFFFVFFYISLLSNSIFFIQFMFLIYLLNIYNLEYVIKKHNETIHSLTLDVRNRELFITSTLNNNDNQTINMEIAEYKSQASSDDATTVDLEVE